MYCLNIALGNISWRLLFKNEKEAIEATAKLAETTVVVADDYDQVFSAHRSSIHGWMLEDLDKTKMAHIEMALHQERTRIAATKAAQSDPGLKEALRPSGPGIINPMGNGFRPPGAL